MLNYLFYNSNPEEKLKGGINFDEDISFFGTITSNQFHKLHFPHFLAIQWEMWSDKYLSGILAINGKSWERTGVGWKQQ